MELKNYDKLQILTAKTLDLHKKVNDRIKQQNFSFCGHCSSHGRYCVVADGSPDEREGLIAVADSLKELHSLVLSLAFRVQKKVGWNHHKPERDEALLGRIEESRKVVRERARRFSESGGVIAEVIEFVGDDDADGESGESLWDLKWEMLDEEKNKKKSVHGIYRFLVGTARFGLEFLVVFATIYASLEFARISGKQHKDEDVRDSRIQQQPRFLLTHDDIDVSLDVLRGRG